MSLTRATDLVAAARGQIQNLSDEHLADALHHDSVVLVDLREPSERIEHGVIPGAVHIPRGVLEFAADPALPSHRPELDPENRIVLHCAAGGRSALAALTLMRMGFPDVAHLDGGFEAWRLAGREVERVDARSPRPR